MAVEASARPFDLRLIRQHSRLARSQFAPSSALDAFIKHFAYIRLTMLEALQTNATAVVFGMRADSASARVLRIDNAVPVSSVVVGRDPHAELRFPNDPAMHRRHALVRVARTRDGVNLRAFDLTGSARFILETGMPCSDVVSDGDLFIRVGDTNILAFIVSPAHRAWTGAARDAWDTLPPRVVVNESTKPGVEIDTDPQHTQIVRMRRPTRQAGEPIDFDTAFCEPTITYRLPSDDTRELGRITGLTITVRTVLGAHTCNFTEERLALPVTIGRDEHCDIQLDDRAGSDAVSRVHAVIVREGRGFWVHDTASKEGTTIDKQPVRSAYLRNGTTVLLAGAVQIVVNLRYGQF